LVKKQTKRDQRINLASDLSPASSQIYFRQQRRSSPDIMSSWASFSSSVKQKKEPSQQSLALVSKEKGSNLGASSSFLGLKAELAAQRKGGSTSKGGSDGKGYLGKGDRKLPAHLRPSPDVLARSLRHDQRQTTSSWANTPSSQLDAARRALEKKAAIYDKLKSGATGGLDEEALQDSLIDWDRKAYHQDGVSSSASSDEEDDTPIREKGSGSANDSDEDPMTEYEDDFGRMRRVRRSRLPRSVLQDRQKQKEEEQDESLISYGPSTSFPVYQPGANISNSDERMQDGYKRRGGDHFDAQFEKRYRGAGFYQFSQDEETRKRQMEAIKEDRDETERIRRDRNADGKVQSLAERKREERRKLVEKTRREIDEKRKRLSQITS
jgi:hypothetical protein